MELIDILQSILKNAVLDRVFPGCVVGVVFRDGRKIVLPYGRFTYDQDQPLMQENTIFDVASITKSIPTSCLALYLLDQKEIELDDLVSYYIPEFKNNYSGQITVKALLTFGLEFPFSLSKLNTLSAKQLLERILTTDFVSPPYEKVVFANGTSILLSILIERVCKKPFADLAQEIFFKPLGMNHTSFFPQEFDKSKIAPTEYDTRGKIIQGEVHDEATYILQKEHIVGSSGLFSTVPDLLHFCSMLLGSGQAASKRFFSEEIISAMGTNQNEKVKRIGLGWELSTPWMGSMRSPHTFGKTGFTGCSVLCDLERGVGIVLFSNRTYPKRPSSPEAIHHIRSKIADSVFTTIHSSASCAFPSSSTLSRRS